MAEQASRLVARMRRQAPAQLAAPAQSSELDELRAAVAAQNDVNAALREELAKASEIVLALSKDQEALVHQVQTLRLAAFSGLTVGLLAIGVLAASTLF